MLSAEIIRLCDQRAEADANLALDMRTAVDVAIRLQEIEACWGTDWALEHVAECQAMLRRVLATF